MGKSPKVAVGVRRGSWQRYQILPLWKILLILLFFLSDVSAQTHKKEKTAYWPTKLGTQQLVSVTVHVTGIILVHQVRMVRQHFLIWMFSKFVANLMNSFLN